MGVPLQNLLDSLPVPIFVVNDNAVVQSANKRGYSLLNKSAQQVQNKLGGIVFDCSYAQLPEGCGKTIHCSGCAIRRSVLTTFETGTSLHEVPATLHSGAPDKPQKIVMHISTEKLGEVVLLRVDRFG